MANSILNSDDGSVSGSAGLKFTAGDDGVLKIQNNGTDALTIADTGAMTFAQQPVVPVPAFQVYQTSNQTLTNNTDTVAVLDTVDYDTNSWFSTSTYKYTPQIAGYYFFRAFMVLSLNGSVTTQQCKIAKNDTVIHRTINRFTITSTYYQECTGVLYLNGTTDYAEMRVQGTGTTTCQLVAGATSETRSSFSGFLVRAA